MIYLEIILAILNLALILYIAFFKSYLTEKGKNYATKEDIAEITKKIETVKNEVSFSNNQKSEWLDRNKIALLNYLDSYIDWTEHGIENISFIASNPFGSDKIRILLDDLFSMHASASKCYWQLCLFEYDDKEFTEKIRKIHLQAYDLHNIVFEFLSKMEGYAVTFELSIKHNSVIKDDKIYEKTKTIDEFIKNRDQKKESVLDNAAKLMNLMRKKIAEKYNSDIIQK